MKHFILFLLLTPFLATAQFVDDFSDGNFNSNPSWSGDVSEFVVNSGFELQSAGPAQSDTSYLSTSLVPLFTDTITWEFFWKMDFNPSNNNNSRVFLLSNSQDLEGSLNGYLVRIGENGSSDPIKLYRQDGSPSNTSLLLTGSTVYGISPELRIRVLRYPNGDWEVYSDPSGGSNFVLEGTFNDATYTSASHFGVWCKYSSQNGDKFYFDDFVVTGQQFQDITPPSIQSVTVSQSDELTLTFSEPLDPVTAESVGNYSVDNGLGSPVNASIGGSNSDEVVLSFGNNFVLGQSYNISIDNVEDLNGNSISPTVQPFAYFVYETPSFRDIVINEFMADPNPPVVLPDAEFVELLNASNKYFNLTGFQIGDASSEGNLQGAEIPLGPGEFLILCSTGDTGLFSPFGTVVPVSSFPALNNTGDDIRLIDSAGNVIDLISYTTAWYNDDEKDGGGFSIEQINPFTPCNGAGNWAASNSFDGGTPGAINSIYDIAPDTLSPRLSDFELLDNRTLELSFTEGIDSTALVNGGFSLSNGIDIDSLTLFANDFSKVILNLDAALDSAILYSLEISDLEDCIGNVMNDTTIQFGLGVSPKAFEILITELYPDPDENSGLPLAEFVEIYNATDKLLRIADIQISDRSSSSFLFNDVLLPGEYAVVCDDGFESDFESFGKVIPVSSMPSLNNADDEISLIKGSTTLDVVPYRDSWYGNDKKDDGGYSLERIDPEELCGLSQNWRASNDLAGGTPGAENSIHDPGSVVSNPVITGVQIWALDQINVSVDKRLDSAGVAAASFSIPGFPSTSKSLDETLSSVSINFAEPLSRGSEYELTINNLSDCIGRTLSNSGVSFYLHDEGDIIINEVLFNPRESGTDFVELYNNSDFEINLQGWAMTYFDSNDSLRFNQITEEVYLLESGGYVCLNEDSANVILNYPMARANTFLTMNLPSYSNTEGSVILHDPLSDQMDRFDYDEDYHFALIKDADGVSLERLDPDRETNDPGNWHSASSTDNYATPGYVNSQANELSSASDAISLSSDIFSPDNDGYQDVVNINYELSETGWSAVIKVFDSKGYQIRELVSNQILGFEGTFTWDGTTDEREKARTGIHIIHVELFDLDGNREEYRLPCVVATKL